MLRLSQYRGLWLTLAITVFCRHGATQPAPTGRVVLEYGVDAALGCPSSSELKASVTGRLGYDPFASEGAEQRLRVELTKVAERVEAQIEWIDAQSRGEGERRLISDDGDCTAFARSLAFALAVQIQLHASDSEPPPSEPLPSEPPPSASPPAPPRVPAAPPPAAKPARPSDAAARRVILLAVGPMLRHGFTPGVSPGLRVAGAISKGRALLELSAHGTLPGELHFADGTGFSAHELGANLVPCLRFSPVGVCAVGTLSLLNVRGQGVDHIRSPSSLTGGVGTRLQVLWPALERFGVLVQGEALVVLAPRDVFLNQTRAWSTDPVVFTVILDFAAIFP